MQAPIFVGGFACMVGTDHAGEALHKKHFKNLGAGGLVTFLKK
jgi:hypothetical protein